MVSKNVNQSLFNVINHQPFEIFRKLWFAIFHSGSVIFILSFWKLLFAPISLSFKWACLGRKANKLVWAEPHLWFPMHFPLTIWVLVAFQIPNRARLSFIGGLDYMVHMIVNLKLFKVISLVKFSENFCYPLILEEIG